MSSTDYSKELAKMFQNDSFAQVYLNTEHVPTNIEETAPVSDIADDNIATTGNTVQHVSSPQRRPTTRSQTGTVTKRRARDDAQVIEVRKRALPARKRQKVPTNAQGSSTPDTQDSASPKPPTREASLSSTSSAPILPVQPPQLTFYHSSMSEPDQPQICHPRSRATLPTPIPNLTKKSRGRRVPIKDATIADPNQKDTRLYVCSVEGCGKCFHRGEHLKRHIRSIHTHEKPFQCTFPLCEKYFNRHDNLLQHLKVHRQANSLPDHPPLIPKRTTEGEPCDATSVSALLPHPHHRSQRSYSPDEDEDEDEQLAPPASPPARPRTIYDAFPPRYTPFSATSTASAPSIVFNHLGTNNFNGNNSNSSNLAPVDDASTHGNISSNETMSILANVAVSSLRMEVSSLRTELPQSPLGIRAGFGATQLSPC